ncbi:hypothetical protein BHU24_25125 [Bacillus pseudomycoides]|uniref:hypothetical protein n=1 Tax=Bacillus pseudomycoides TaxID=64104 RepID=UPI000BEB2FC6|nr:hypothetical protein [Bacillus pseudomycoides]MBD5799857.1 hypothetical protein [Bacillus pseudomycoides]MED1476521.1 hypothetical protein [Bacillus pseudomycoides]PDZ13440.1 hypothetical protein CON70_01595 [Bacillus pseudomycoides]PEO83566.1 hypothetical protein CN571_24735 [Bacillus pseudomycoides]
MKQEKNHFILEESVTKLSIAIRLKDDFTDDEPIGNVTVSIKGIEKKPVKNLTGYYLFTNLPPKLDKVEVVVNSDFYLKVNAHKPIVLITDNPVVDEISLKPHCSYPFQVGSTLLRAVVRKKTDQRAIPEASVKAIVFQPESMTTARVGKDAMKGEKTIQLESCASGMKLNDGDVLMIEESNMDKMEFCQIAARLQGNPALETYNLVDGLKFDHSNGTPLFLMKDQNKEFATRTDEKGEMVMHFKRSKATRFLIDVTISKEGYQDVKLDKIEMSEGTTNCLGVIELLPNSSRS